MKINWEKGKKGKKDRILKIKSDNGEQGEWFSIFKLALLTNQLAVNELENYGDIIKQTGNFFFRNAIMDAIESAELGIDWAQQENKDKVLQWCKRYKLKFESVEPELRKHWQTKLTDFTENEN